MPKAECLHPIDRPQCEAQRETKYRNDTKDTDKQCKGSSRYKIDGHYFCSKHAGVAALQILLRESQKRPGSRRN
jgi:hypothetical protein